MVCSDCTHYNICKYRDDTESYERNYTDTIYKSPLNNLTISIVCKYKQYTSLNLGSYTNTPWTLNDVIYTNKGPDCTVTRAEDISTTYTT